MRSRDVVERHHHDAEEEHGGNCADPIPVGGKNSVLVSRRCPTHEFQRAEVRRDEAQSRDPCRHVTAGEEEIFAGFRESLQIEADPEHHYEIQADDDQIDGAEGQQLLVHARSSSNLVTECGANE